jgi:hypothetical protein
VCTGCGSEQGLTQVLVVFEAGQEVKQRGGLFRVRVWNLDGDTEEPRYDRTHRYRGFSGQEPDFDGFPETVPLVPRDGKASRRFRILGEVLEPGPERERVARQQAISSYLDNQLGEIRLRLVADCPSCGPEENCVEQECTSAEVDPVPIDPPPG